MTASINLIIYLLGGKTEVGKKTVGFAGAFGYTYDVNEKGKKQIAKDVPTTQGYHTGGGAGSVVNPIDVITLTVPGSADEHTALIHTLLETLNYAVGREEILNLGLIGKYPWLEKLLTVDLAELEKREGKLGRLELSSASLALLPALQTAYRALEGRSKLWFNFDKSAEGGLGMRSAHSVQAMAEVISTWSSDKDPVMTIVDNKTYWNPESDFNKIVSASRWYCNTGEGNEYYDSHEGYRRYDFGKIDKKKYYGKSTPDVTYSCLFSKEPITLLDKLFDFTVKKTKNPKGLLVAGDLQFVKSKDVARLIDTQPGTVKGKDIVIPFKVGGAEEPTLMELIDPPGLSYRITDIFDNIGTVFHAFLNKGEDNRYGEYQRFYEITDRIYTKEVNGKGVTKLKLSPEFKITTNAIRVDVVHRGAVRGVPVNLGVGYDIPERNAFNSVSDPNVRVWVGTDESNDRCLFYRTIVETSEWIYILTAGCANVRVLSKSELGQK